MNSLRGLRDKDDGAAKTGDGETTQQYARYVDPRESKLIWYDIPGSGSINHPSWEYFSKESLFIFDTIIVVIGPTLMETDIDLLQQAKALTFPIPTHIVRAKSDIHILERLRSEDIDEDDIDGFRKVKKEFSLDTREAIAKLIERASLPVDTKFYQVNKYTMLALVKDDEKGWKKYGRYMLDEGTLVNDLFDDVGRRRRRQRHHDEL